MRNNVINPDSMCIHQRVLTYNNASQIKKLINRGISLNEIADKFSIHETTVRDIRDGRSFAYVEPAISQRILDNVSRFNRYENPNEEYYEKKEYAHRLLGNKCAFCGSTKSLRMDIIDKKSYPNIYPSQILLIKQKYWEKMISEVCRLLCKDCWVNYRHLVIFENEKYSNVTVLNDFINKKPSPQKVKAIQKHVKVTDDRILTAIQLHKSGMKVKEISIQLKVSSTTIYKWFERVKYYIY